MKRIYYKSGSWKDVEDSQAWEYEDDPYWEKTVDLNSTNKCGDGTKIPEGGCFGCAEGKLCE